MEKKATFSVSEVKQINMEEYPSDEFSVVALDILGSNPNSHNLVISNEVLREYAKTALDKWIVADIRTDYMGRKDCSSHTPEEKIMGIIPKEQDIVFVEKEDYLRATCYGVVSKLYAKDFCEMFVNDNSRSVSVEFTYEPDPEDENIVKSFRITAVTVLGHTVRPSSPGSDIKFVRFSSEDADAYFQKFNHKSSLSTLKQFAEQRKLDMEEKKTYKIDKSKEAVSDTAWGKIDKNAMRKKIVEASNASELVKAVYCIVESNWREAPSEALKYPIMELKGDTFVYNKNAISSALAYAKQHNETEVVSKLNKIRKKLDLDESNGKEEKAEMEEVKTVEMSEETMAETEPEKEKEEAKMEDCPCMDNDDDNDDKKEEMSAEDMKAKIDQMAKDIEERDNIIMEKDKELSELREFKAGIEKKELACSVESVLSEVKDCMSEEKLSELREEGLACTKDNFAAFANKARACAFESVKGKTAKKNDEIMTFAVPNGNTKVDSTSPWD